MMVLKNLLLYDISLTALSEAAIVPGYVDTATTTLAPTL